jgi:hypothetical protein
MTRHPPHTLLRLARLWQRCVEHGHALWAASLARRLGL